MNQPLQAIFENHRDSHDERYLPGGPPLGGRGEDHDAEHRQGGDNDSGAQERNDPPSSDGTGRIKRQNDVTKRYVEVIGPAAHDEPREQYQEDRQGNGDRKTKPLYAPTLHVEGRCPVR